MSLSPAVPILEVPAALMRLLTAEQARHYRVLPKEQQGREIHLWADDQADTNSLQEELEIVLGQRIRLFPVTRAAVDGALDRYFPKASKAAFPAKTVAPSPEKEGEAFLWQLISDARSLKSSDIHLESYPDRCRARIRVDGKLLERYQITKDDYPALVNQVKILSNLDIAERRLPQDGRIYYNKGTDRFDIRVSVLPTLHGEKVVMRLLSQDATRIDLETLGFGKEELERYLEAAKRPTGMMLISGPTGSGKTTTLYATLKLLNQTSRNILTIEDPIEYTLEGINQSSLKEAIGFGFPQALRTFLRQDPDVIMVGEIRDAETAQMAIRASLTGHLVLSTIHTNSAWGTISRLVDMGIPPFLVAATLHTSVAQRLVRLLCPQCKTEVPLSKSAFPPGFQPPFALLDHFVSKGCAHCHFTGYQGRKALYEVISLDQTLARMVKEGRLEVESYLRERGVATLAERAFLALAAGETSLEEVYPLLYAF